MKIFMIVLIVIIVIIVALGLLLSNLTMGIKRQSLEEARAWQEERYDLSWYDEANKEDFIVTSFDGYEIHAQLIPANGALGDEKNSAASEKKDPTSEKYVIISHGYSDNRFGALKYARIYLDRGYNVIIYDLRGHGLNEKTFCTYSIRESEDLKALIEDTRDRHPEADVLGIQGESLGAATSVAVLKYKPDIDFVVADCPFSDIKGVLKGGLKAMHLPGGLVDLASICDKVRYGYSLDEMRPIDCLEGNEVPLLFMHGEADELITPDNSRRLAEATSGYSELHLIPSAALAESVLTDPEGYEEFVDAFLDRVEAEK